MGSGGYVDLLKKNVREWVNISKQNLLFYAPKSEGRFFHLLVASFEADVWRVESLERCWIAVLSMVCSSNFNVGLLI